MARYFWRAWLVCGTLDIVYAAILSLLLGGTVKGMLLSVASGPFGNGVAGWGVAGAVAGLLVHYAIMAVMVLVFGLLVRHTTLRAMSPWLSGALYGVALYLVMYWIVLPLRFPSVHPVTDAMKVVRALFPHIVLVGWPMAFIACHMLNRRT
jgi:hypothetical protein